VLRDQGDLAGALAAFQESQAIRERLAAGDPSNALWQRDLAVSYHRLATSLEIAKEKQKSQQYWELCRDTRRRMKGVGMFLDPTLLKLLSQLDEKIG
jgi:hypothetical protein